MAFDFNKVNKERLFTVDTSTFEYITQEELYNEIYTVAGCNSNEEVEDIPIAVRGVYINKKGKYGPQPVVATDQCYISLPQSYLETIEEILRHPAAIEAINNGECCMFISKYVHPRYKNTCYSFEFGNC